MQPDGGSPADSIGNTPAPAGVSPSPNQQPSAVPVPGPIGFEGVTPDYTSPYPEAGVVQSFMLGISDDEQREFAALQSAAGKFGIPPAMVEALLQASDSKDDVFRNVSTVVREAADGKLRDLDLVMNGLNNIATAEATNSLEIQSYISEALHNVEATKVQTKISSEQDIAGSLEEARQSAKSLAAIQSKQEVGILKDQIKELGETKQEVESIKRDLRKSSLPLAAAMLSGIGLIPALLYIAVKKISLSVNEKRVAGLEESVEKGKEEAIERRISRAERDREIISERAGFAPEANSITSNAKAMSDALASARQRSTDVRQSLNMRNIVSDASRGAAGFRANFPQGRVQQGQRVASNTPHVDAIRARSAQQKSTGGGRTI